MNERMKYKAYLHRTLFSGCYRKLFPLPFSSSQSITYRKFHSTARYNFIILLFSLQQSFFPPRRTCCLQIIQLRWRQRKHAKDENAMRRARARLNCDLRVARQVYSPLSFLSRPSPIITREQKWRGLRVRVILKIDAPYTGESSSVSYYCAATIYTNGLPFVKIRRVPLIRKNKIADILPQCSFLRFDFFFYLFKLLNSLNYA